MPTRTISLSEEAYDRLATAKLPGESFTEVVLRVVVPGSFDDLAGILTEEQGAQMKRKLRELRRKDTRAGLRRTARMSPDAR